MLTPSRTNAAVLFLDLQEEIVKNARTIGQERLQRVSGVLAKLAALHNLPALLSAVPPGGAFLDVITKALPRSKPMLRTDTSAFADPALVAALKATGRNVLVLSGVASEIVVQRTALDALQAGYDVHVAVDACGGIDPRTEDAAWRRIVAAGAVTTSVITFGAEIVEDFSTEAGGKTLALVYETMAE